MNEVLPEPLGPMTARRWPEGKYPLPAGELARCEPRRGIEPDTSLLSVQVGTYQKALGLMPHYSQCKLERTRMCKQIDAVMAVMARQAPQDWRCRHHLHRVSAWGLYSITHLPNSSPHSPLLPHRLISSPPPRQLRPPDPTWPCHAPPHHIAWHGITSHRIASYLIVCIRVSTIPACPALSYPVSSHPIPSCPIACDPILPHPIPSHPIPSHPMLTLSTPSLPSPPHRVPSHPSPSHPIPACRAWRLACTCTWICTCTCTWTCELDLEL